MASPAAPRGNGMPYLNQTSLRETPLLLMQDITKRFGGNVAVNNVTLKADAGRIVALLGENGAGKSTLIKVLAGVYSKDAGEIQLSGRRIGSAADFAAAREKPIAFIHQDLGLIDWMTAAENMAFSMGFPKRFGLVDWKAVTAGAREALRQVGVDIDPGMRVFELSRTEKSLLAIARAISVKAQLLVLDEPTASLPADDVRRLFKVLDRLRAEGVGMVYVTHRLDEVMEIADDVMIMRDGVKVVEGETKYYGLRDLVRMIVGEEKKESHRRETEVDGETVLTADNLVVGDVGPVSFSVRRGELLALSGLRGAGQEDIGRALFGLRTVDAGALLLEGAPYKPASPQDAIRSGVNMVAGDRTNESLVMSLTVRENMFLNPVAQGSRLLSSYPSRRESEAGRRLADEFDVRPRDVDVDVSALSGGNQQKVVMARWLNVPGRVLLLEDPTAGVDVGARAEIYRLLRQALDKGLAVILISSDMEEIAAISSRALVFNRGRVAGELRGAETTFANMLAMASAGAGT